jgi:hypothetical protein
MFLVYLGVILGYIVSKVGKITFFEKDLDNHEYAHIENA